MREAKMSQEGDYPDLALMQLELQQFQDMLGDFSLGATKSSESVSKFDLHR